MILKREKQANKFSGNNSLNRSVPPWPSSRSFCFFAKRFNFHWGCQGSEVSERGLCCVNQWTRSKMVCLLSSHLLGHKLWFWVGDKIYVGDDNLAMWDKNRQTSDHFDCHHAELSWAELGLPSMNTDHNLTMILKLNIRLFCSTGKCRSLNLSMANCLYSSRLD